MGHDKNTDVSEFILFTHRPYQSGFRLLQQSFCILRGLVRLNPNRNLDKQDVSNWTSQDSANQFVKWCNLEKLSFCLKVMLPILNHVVKGKNQLLQVVPDLRLTHIHTCECRGWRDGSVSKSFLLLWKTQLQFLEPMSGGSQTSVAPAPGRNLMPLVSARTHTITHNLPPSLSLNLKQNKKGLERWLRG